MTERVLEILFEHQHRGVEFDWLAADHAGHVGFFSTAGFGPIPAEVLGSNAIENVESLVKSLPVVANAVVSREWGHDIGDWTRVAARGLFAFDWRISTSSYDLIARPERPISVSLFVERTTQFSHLVLPMNFASLTRISANKLGWTAE